MFAKQRLYLTADKSSLVGFGHANAAFLYASEGDEIPDSAADRFGLVDGALKPGKANKVDTMLLGSSVLPAQVEISAGVSVQLGVIVLQAQKASGLGAEDWNGLPEPDREARLAATVEAMRQKAASRATAKTPKTPRAPRKAKAAAAGKQQAPAENKEQLPAEDKGQKPSDDKGGAATGNAP